MKVGVDPKHPVVVKAMAEMEATVKKAHDTFLKAVDKAREDFLKAIAPAHIPMTDSGPVLPTEYNPDWKTPDGHLSAEGRIAIGNAYAGGWDDKKIASVFKISETAARRNRERHKKGVLSDKPRKAEVVREVIGFYKGTAGWSEEQQQKSAIDTVMANLKMDRGMARKYVMENWPKVEVPAKAA